MTEVHEIEDVRELTTAELEEVAGGGTVVDENGDPAGGGRVGPLGGRF